SPARLRGMEATAAAIGVETSLVASPMAVLGLRRSGPSRADPQSRCAETRPDADHAAHRLTRPLLAVRGALGRRPDLSGPVQGKLRHRVAELVVAPLLHLLVEVHDREVLVLVPVKPEQPLHLLRWRAPRRPSAAPIDEPSLASCLVALSPS